MGSSSYDNACVDPPAVEEELVFSLSQELNPHKSMGPEEIHPRALSGWHWCKATVYYL